MTSLAEERETQRQWRLRGPFARVRWFDKLIANEFLAAEDRRARQSRMLRRLVNFAAAEVPYYAELLACRGLSPTDIRNPEDLARLPLLTKRDVSEHAARLRPRALPKGERPGGHTKSSGTTGRPTKVYQTAASNRMFGILKQREFRWFRFDPARKLAIIRLPSQLPRTAKGAELAPGETLSMAGWPYAARYFVTGPAVALSVLNPVEEQIAWLRRERPDYLMTYSETLEHLAFAAEGGRPADSLRGLIAISEQLTASMRRRIEASFAAPVHQNYGLNEIGLVAVRCDSGRYHVHVEHCLVEIGDGEGRPVAPGERGRIIVTPLQNFAMPLLRYDTDDTAVALAGPCPCGRTLPAFGEVVGRYSRIAFLPEGTLGWVGQVRDALEEMPAALARNLRQFQMHQFRDNRFELRLVTAGPLPPEFLDRIHAAWRTAVGARGSPLRIVEVDRIARGPGGKFQDFTSDFIPLPDRDE